MKTLSVIQVLSRLGKVLSKIAFIFSLIGFCGCIAGLLSLCLGSGNLLKIGGITLHGLIPAEAGFNIKSIAGALSGWLVVCAGEAVMAKFAEIYFKNELKAGTPFTYAGAEELLRLGILTLAIPTVCAIIGGVLDCVIASLTKALSAALQFDREATIVLGIMMILGALLCRYGAEQNEKYHAEEG